MPACRLALARLAWDGVGCHSSKGIVVLDYDVAAAVPHLLPCAARQAHGVGAQGEQPLCNVLHLVG
jgi:hypothetical protein